MATQTQRRLAAVPEPRDAQQRVASSIKALARIQGIKQSDLAAAADMDSTALSKALKPNVRRMTVDEMERIAEALDAPVQLLYLGGDEIQRRAMAGVLDATTTGPRDPAEQVNQTFPCHSDDLAARRSRRALPVLPISARAA